MEGKGRYTRIVKGVVQGGSPVLREECIVGYVNTADGSTSRASCAEGHKVIVSGKFSWKSESVES